jgi:malate synthase
MEDAATAEISRTQLWQWIHHGARLEDGTPVTAALYRGIRADELKTIEKRLGKDGFRASRFELAASLFDRLIEAPALEDFLTLPAYRELVRIESSQV